MDLNLAGKVAFVTGAGSGMGRAIAEILVKEGCRVHLADINLEAVEQAAQACRAGGGRAAAVACNVGDADEVAAVIRQVVQADDHIDILVNSAGILKTGSIVDAPLSDWAEVERINLCGVLYCSKAVMPTMISRRYGKIINIASISAFRGGGSLGNTLYGTSKAGVVALTMGMARELGPSGINVNAIAPAVTLSSMTQSFMDESTHAAIIRRIPLGRIGTALDTATLSAFLASDVSAFISGVVIPVDGGLLTT